MPGELYREFIYKYYKHLFVLLSVFCWSCASTAPLPPGSRFYNTEFPLSTETAYSVSTPLEVKIPTGWFTAEDNDCKCIDLWLIRNDFSAAINLVQLDTPLIIDSLETELNRILAVSKETKSDKLPNGFIQSKEDEFFVLNDRKYAAYEYQGDEGMPIRVVVFRYNDKYFELSAVPAAGVGKRSVNTIELFNVQQSVLSSLK